ncbi:MAG: DUF4982 domain-containing protein [Clostridia bacterium]|nr:DUF4982 domain-containing protein [Clostridia bacterium]
MQHVRKRFLMDPDWRFHRGQLEQQLATKHSAVYNSVKAGSAKGPGTKGAFDDSDWERVDLPHDYLREAEFSPDAVGNHGGRVKCDGWYRKTFVVDPQLRGKHAMLIFGGISTAATIYFNGSIAERSFSAYSEIAIDVTDRLYFDRINTLAVYVQGDQNEGWWYEGAGIYRHVYLDIKSPLHMAHNGVFSKPVLLDETTDTWELQTEITLKNSDYTAAKGAVRVTLLDGDRVIASATGDEILCNGDQKAVTTVTLPIVAPHRWDVDDPKLYTVVAELLCDGEVVDDETLRTGFRTFAMTPDKGLFLNGRFLKIKGTCNHQDHAGVGVAVPDSIQRFRIQKLKEMGCNAYRCAHNPPARELLDACDELGVLVMDENRRFEASAAVIANLETMVRRDRNHPSVIFYSLFNEEPLQNSGEGLKIFRRLRAAVERLDTSRLIVGATNDVFHPGGAGEAMDVLAMNYGIRKLEQVHSTWPNKPIMGCENCSEFATRGCYQSDTEAHVCSCYDEDKAPWGSNVRDNWRVVRAHDYFAGSFTWTGFDYRGEPTPFTWPSCSSQFGLMDLCGFPKDGFYFQAACFMEQPMIHLLPHWNYKNGDTVRVMTVTNCPQVELLLNGRSLGVRDNDICEQQEWQVPFEPGVLTAVGYQNGKAVVTDERRTAGEAVAIQLTPDRTLLHDQGQDTVPIRVSVVDRNGIEVPTADHLIHFEIVGDGVLAGVGNGDPNSHEPEHLPYRHLFAGLCQVLITAKQNAKALKLIARGEGLESAEVSFALQHLPAPDSIFFKSNNAVSGILASVSDEAEKPDPDKVYGDDDMNSFAPMVLEKNQFGNYLPSGFHSGWRVYRIPVTVPKGKTAGQMLSLEIASIVCEKAEFYVDGQLIFEATPEYKAALSVPCPDHTESEFEVRALLKARTHTLGSNGFAYSICLSLSDKK